MGLKTCVIYDENEQYGKRLFAGLLKKARTQFNVMLFTGKTELEKCIQELNPDVLLVCEECMDDWMLREYKGNVIILTEEMLINEEMIFYGKTCSGVYRYQPIEQLYEDIVSRGGLQRSTRLKILDIIGVYSPVNDDKRELFSLALSKAMSEKFKTLYINLSEFSGLSALLPTDNDYNLSDALYFYHQNNEVKKSKMDMTIKSIAGMDYISPVICGEDISDVGAGELADFMEETGELYGYEVIIADISSAVKHPWKLLEVCSRIYVPERADYLSQMKQADFEMYTAGIGMEHVLEQMERIKLPDTGECVTENLWNIMADGRMYRFVKDYIEANSKKGRMI